MAQGNYGTPDNRVNIVAERWQYTPHTSDPADTGKGDEWLRVDMDSGDRIATLRFEYNDSGDVWDVPVFPVSETPDSEIKKVLRIGTPNGEGFVPISEGGGVFRQRGFQFDGARHGLHDSLFSLPNSVIHRWPYDEGSGSTVADNIGSIDGAINGASWTSGTWIGGQALSHNGTSDYVDFGDPAYSPGANDSFSVFATVQTGTAADQIFLSNRSSGDGWSVFMQSDGSFCAGIQNSPSSDFATDGSAGLDDGSKHRVVAVFDRANNNIIRYVDGSTTGTTMAEDVGSVAPSGNLNAARRPNDTGYLSGQMDEPMVADEAVSAVEVQNDYDRQPWS